MPGALCFGPQRAAQGYALVELLLSVLITCSVTGVLLQFAVRAQQVLQTQAEVSDVQQRLRVAASAIQRDLSIAGAGPSQGAWRGRLNQLFAPVRPSRTGARSPDPPLAYYTDRISIAFVADTRAQTSLAANMADGGSVLLIDPATPGCPSGDTCGFNAGDHVLIADPAAVGAAHEIFTVAGADAGRLTPAVPLSTAYRAGSIVARVVQHVYYFDRAGHRLMLYDGGASDLPLVDHVVDLRFSYYADPLADSVPCPATGTPTCVCVPPVPLLQSFGGQTPVRLTAGQLTDGPVCGNGATAFDADLLRVRRIAATIRLEAQGDEFRGAGPAFLRRGTSAGGTRYVPDIEVTFDVSPRNMSATR